MELVAIDWFSQEDTYMKMKRDALVKILLSFCPVQSVTTATVPKKVYYVFVHVKLIVIITCYALKELIDN